MGVHWVTFTTMNSHDNMYPQRHQEVLGAEPSSVPIPGSVEGKKLDSSPTMVTAVFYSGYLLCVLKSKFWQCAAMYIKLTFQINNHKVGWPLSLLLLLEVLVAFVYHWGIKMAQYGVCLLGLIEDQNPSTCQMLLVVEEFLIILVVDTCENLMEVMEIIINLPTSFRT